jgi:hypothetical protein
MSIKINEDAIRSGNTDLELRIAALEAKLDPPPLVATTLWDREVETRIKQLEETVRLICETHLAGRVTELETVVNNHGLALDSSGMDGR